MFGVFALYTLWPSPPPHTLSLHIPILTGFIYSNTEFSLFYHLCGFVRNLGAFRRLYFLIHSSVGVLLVSCRWHLNPLFQCFQLLHLADKRQLLYCFLPVCVIFSTFSWSSPYMISSRISFSFVVIDINEYFNFKIFLDLHSRSMSRVIYFLNVFIFFSWPVLLPFSNLVAYVHFIAQSPFKKNNSLIFPFSLLNHTQFSLFHLYSVYPFSLSPILSFPFSVMLLFPDCVFPLCIFCLLLYAHHMSFSFCQFSFYLFFCALAFVLGTYLFCCDASCKFACQARL